MHITFAYQLYYYTKVDQSIVGVSRLLPHKPVGFLANIGTCTYVLLSLSLSVHAQILGQALETVPSMIDSLTSGPGYM